MKAELTDISTVKKRFEIEIPEDVVTDEITGIARKFAKQARVPGFRPGKAPLGVIKTRYRDDIMSEMYQHLLPHYFSDAAREKNLTVVDSPEFEEVDYEKGAPLRFKAVFEIYPTLDITNHADIPIEEVATEVTEEEVDETLKRMVTERAEMTPVEEDRVVAEGDFVEISFKGTLEGEADEEALSAEKALCEIGGETTIKEFTENLTGARAGEDKSFSVIYRDDHPEPKLAGKSAEYRVHVESIKEKKLPALDDEFAQGLGDYPKLADLRAEVRKNLEEHKRTHADEQTRDALLRWLEENNEFEVPESLVEHQVQVRLQRLMRDLSKQGMNPQQLDLDWGKVRSEQYDQAVRDVRGSLILDHLAEQEKVEVSDEDIDEAIEGMATQMPQSTHSVREALTANNGIEKIKGQISNTKILKILQDRAKVVPAGSLTGESKAEITE